MHRPGREDANGGGSQAHTHTRRRFARQTLWRCTAKLDDISIALLPTVSWCSECALYKELGKGGDQAVCKWGVPSGRDFPIVSPLRE